MKPKVICHIMSSVDGRLLNHRWSLPFNGKDTGELMAVYSSIGRELETDAWMFGRNTAQEGFLTQQFVQTGQTASNPHVFVAPQRSRRMFIVSDPEGKIRYDTETVRGDNIIAILGKQVCDEYLAHLREMNISYLFAGADGYDIEEAMSVLYNDFDIHSISLQGGGIINGVFLKQKLIDELSLVIYPGIDGLSGVPSIFEYLGQADEQPATGQTLELLSVEKRANGVVWLRYKIHKNCL